MKPHQNVLISVCLYAASMVSAQAELFDRGGGFIYDSVLDITWTQNANINGLDNWNNQVAWADSLSLFDSVRGVTWDDWRLPSVNVNGDSVLAVCQFVSELLCRDNEYDYMRTYNGVRPAAPGPFVNLQSAIYWSSSEGINMRLG